MKAKIHVTLKKEVLDPQGDAVRRALVTLGFDQVKQVRVGKFIEVELDGADPKKAENELQSMCEKLLANAVIENFEFQVE